MLDAIDRLLSENPVTTTPTMAAVQDAPQSGAVALSNGLTVADAVGNLTTAYAITYFFGLVGLILIIPSLLGLLGIDLASEAEKVGDRKPPPDPGDRIAVTRSDAVELTLGELGVTDNYHCFIAAASRFQVEHQWKRRLNPTLLFGGITSAMTSGAALSTANAAAESTIRALGYIVAMPSQSPSLTLPERSSFFFERRGQVRKTCAMKIPYTPIAAPFGLGTMLGFAPGQYARGRLDTM